MTSTPVTGTEMMMNNLQSVATPNVTSQVKGDFQSFMKQSQDNLNSGKAGAKTTTKTDIKSRTQNDSVEDTNTPENTESVKTSSEVKTEPERTPSDEEVSEVEETVKDVIKAISDELDVTTDEIEAALEEMGLPLISVLDTSILPELVAEVNDMPDTLSIATDENLFESLKAITETVENAVNDLTEQLNISAEEFNETLQEIENQAAVDFTNQPVVAEEKPKTLEDKIEVKVSDDKPTVRKEISKETGEVKSENSEEREEIKPTEDLKKESGSKDSGLSQKNGSQMSFTENLLNKVSEALNESDTTISYTDYEVQNIIDQITESIKVDVNSEVSEINLKLHPESLGNVSVKISANNEGVLTAEFTAQNDSVKAIIESQAVVLKEALEAKGVTVEAVQVAVQSHQFERNLSDQGRRNDGSGQQKRGIRRINLSEGDLSESIEEDDRVIKEMMAQNGNTIDYSA